MRTEFLFHRPAACPTRRRSTAPIAASLEWAGERPVVVRTLDAGGDKPIAGLTVDGEIESVPRPARHPPVAGAAGVFRVQLRALARAAAHGDVKVMLPMVTVPGRRSTGAAALLDDGVAELDGRGHAARRPPLGIMVEVPAVAIVPELFADADFFSIGSNDLTQYVTASARDIAAVAGARPTPAIRPCSASSAASSRRARDLGREVSLCGDMGGDPRHLPALLAAGLRSVSVAPPLVGRAKLAIAAAIGRAP